MVPAGADGGDEFLPPEFVVGGVEGVGAVGREIEFLRALLAVVVTADAVVGEDGLCVVDETEQARVAIPAIHRAWFAGEGGDTVEVGALMGVVSRIGIRASVVRSYDGAEVIVPNGDLISTQVINWTLSDRRKRIKVPIGVAYGSDPEQVREEIDHVAQVEQGLKSTGAQVGYTSEQLQKMAADLQEKTLFGDEEILSSATAQLLTFTNIAGNQFARTQQAALDLSTRLDGDLKSASIQLGKALNDPIANLSALSRSGIQFSAEQKETIKTLAETNRLADAQTIILDELEKQYGGSAEAAAAAGTGGLKQLQNTLSDLQEEFGALIAEFLPPIIEHVKELVRRFSNMSDETKVLILKAAALAAALGPVLMAFSAMMPAIAAILSPLGLLIAGVVAATAGFVSLGMKINAAVEAATLDAQTHTDGLRLSISAIIPLANRQWFLSHELFEENSEIVTAYEAGIAELHKEIEAAKMEGSFDSDLPTKWIAETYENLIYAAWTMVRDEDATPSQAADMAWRTFMKGVSQ